MVECRRVPTGMSATTGERVNDRRSAGLAWSYGTAIGLGAFLLFEVQPLIARYILPWFGGSIEVWTTCMLFFQVMLLLGYLYAHLITRALSLRGQAAVHGAVLLAALAFLPVVPTDRWRPSGSGSPTLQILLLLVATTGLPFFALSATSPLLQRWIATLRPGRNVYSLYALSNAGSLLALVTYPFVVEPFLARRAQSWTWSAGLIAFAAVMAACAWPVWTLGRGAGEAPPEGRRDPERGRGAVGAADRKSRPAKGERSALDHAPDGGVRDRVLWLLLPAAASMMLLASTNTICLQVAPFPLLWVLPLTLYLLTFIVCFAGERWYSRGVCLTLAAASGLGVAGLRYGFIHTSSIAVQVGIYTAALFTCCMVCHGETYRLRPPPEKLTSFYLVISCGGALGGFLVAVVAPLVFPDYWELYVAMAVSLAAGVAARLPAGKRRAGRWHVARAFPIVALLGGGLALVAVDRGPEAAGRTLERSRNFYGTLRVLEKQVPFRADRPGVELALRELWNGPILHGDQFYDVESRDGEAGRTTAAGGQLPQVAARPSARSKGEGTMARKLITIILVAMFGAVAGARAQGSVTVKEIPKGKTLATNDIGINATVVAVNLETRELTYKRDDGAVRTIVVSEEVKNLPQVKVGDIIKLRYHEAVSIRLDKSSGGTPSTSESSGISRNAPGSKPGAYAGRETTISGSVDKIDALQSVVTLKGPKGRLLDVVVEDKAILGKLNLGDLVVVTYTEALALSVEASPAK